MVVAVKEAMHSYLMRGQEISGFALIYDSEADLKKKNAASAEKKGKK
jgi:hypothetical protein